MPIGIIDISGYVPERVVRNEEIAAAAGIEESWIEERTGIKERRYASADFATSDLAVRAAEPLVTDSLRRRSVGLIIVATSTPDQPQPSTASFVQAQLGLHSIPAFDVNAVCSGFLYSLLVAEGIMRVSSSISNALVIGADKYSSILDKSDARTVSLFGDGAGAVILGRVPSGYGIEGRCLSADGSAAGLIGVVGGGSRRPLTGEGIDAGYQFFRMDGRSVREWALRALPGVARRALDQAGKKIEDVDRLVMHQGNVNLVRSVAAELGIPGEKVAITADLWGNTAAASIPLTLNHDDDVRGIRRGERVLLISVGGGMTAGAVLLSWY